MHDQSGRGARLLPRIASLLPREIRERVFEPAWTDLLLDERAAGDLERSVRGVRFRRLISRWVVVLESLRIAAPGLIWRRGRMRRGVKVAIVLLLTGTILLIMARFGYDSPAAGPAPSNAVLGSLPPG